MTTHPVEFKTHLHGLPVLVTVDLLVPQGYCVDDHEDWSVSECWLLGEDGLPSLDLVAAGLEADDCEPLTDAVEEWLSDHANDDLRDPDRLREDRDERERAA